jgi:hypothetical protein
MVLLWVDFAVVLAFQMVVLSLAWISGMMFVYNDVDRDL